ncbi:MAG: iron-containing redox enzyme family protein [Conexibacter sp.]|nr:iron-containing redox enzyme family protein [Conexibacter sp.]
MPVLPTPRGPLSATVLTALRGAPGSLPAGTDVPTPGDALADDDLHLALYACYELHYRGFDGVDERWEWDPGLVALRATLEAVFEHGLHAALDGWTPPAADDTTMDLALRAIADADDSPSLSRHLERHGTLEEFKQVVIHRSAYQLKEADPHSWAIPRLAGGPKAALIEIQADEYGGGDPARMHARLFADTMEELGLDPAYGAYVDALPGATLATVNLMSMFGLHRRHRGAIVGHLALFEMTSSIPNRRYATALRRLGVRAPRATEFYDEHVTADAVHENVAAVDLAGGLVRQEPALKDDILFGARALVELEGRWATMLLEAWAAQQPTLRSTPRAEAVAA